MIFQSIGLENNFTAFIKFHQQTKILIQEIFIA
jgi:hypothetical protein